jgi:hypothetical protein
MANPLTTADIEKLADLLKSSEAIAFGRGPAPTNSSVSSTVWPSGTKYVTVSTIGHTQANGYTYRTVYDYTTHNTSKMGWTTSHTCIRTSTTNMSEIWSAHSTNHNDTPVNLNHIWHHFSHPDTWTTKQIDDMEQNIKDIEADSNATLTEIWPTQKANKDTRPFWFEQFGSSTLAYQSKRKRKRASQSFI